MFPIRNTYLCTAAILIEFILFIVSSNCILNRPIFYFLKNVRYFISYITLYEAVMFPFDLDVITLDVKIRSYYRIFFFTMIIYMYYLDLNILVTILITISNTGVILFVQYKLGFGPNYLLSDLIANIVCNFFVFLIKKDELKNKKEVFFEYYKNSLYMDYIKELFNVLQMKLISIKIDNSVLFINKFAKNFFNKYFPRNSESQVLSPEEEDVKFTPANYEASIKEYLNSLQINKDVEDELVNQNEKKSFIEFLPLIFKDENYNSTFKSTGLYSIYTPELNNCYEIHVRKIKAKEEVLELLIYDVTEIKQAQKTKTESKYKQMILAKIAHEFKTPLITIISLINIIFEKHRNMPCDKCGDSIIVKLNHIKNYSNYTIVLINDIISYVSGSNQLKIFKQQINLKEVIIFCYNILKTLVDCNEMKRNNIDTSLEIDDLIDDFIIISDENRVKQILLNLISNSVKFTQKGYIKLKANFITERLSVELTLKDSGIGIKEEDKHLIFKESVQLNLERNYHTKGSGLGLSISKTIADYLGCKLWFESKYEKGTNFFLELNCEQNKKKLRERSKTILSQSKLINEKQSKDIEIFNYSNNNHNLSINSDLLLKLNCKQNNTKVRERKETVLTQSYKPINENESKDIQIFNYSNIKQNLSMESNFLLELNSQQNKTNIRQRKNTILSQSKLINEKKYKNHEISNYSDNLKENSDQNNKKVRIKKKTLLSQSFEPINEKESKDIEIFKFFNDQNLSIDSNFLTDNNLNSFKNKLNTSCNYRLNKFIDDSNIKTSNNNHDLLGIYNFGFTLGELRVNDSNLSVVVIDDYKLIRENTVNLVKSAFATLKITDYSIIEGSDGIDLLNIVRNDKANTIKIVFTDENMEYLNGSDTVRIIKKLEDKAMINKYFYASVTAFEDEETRNNIMKSGINSIISKPCTKSTILSYLKNIKLD